MTGAKRKSLYSGRRQASVREVKACRTRTASKRDARRLFSKLFFMESPMKKTMAGSDILYKFTDEMECRAQGRDVTPQGTELHEVRILLEGVAGEDVLADDR